MTNSESSQVLVFDTPHGKQTLYFGSTISPSLLRDYDRILVLVDKKIEQYPLVKQLCKKITARDGTKVMGLTINSKTKDTRLMTEVLDAMCEHSMTRSSLLVSIGGGSMHDLAGVCASVFMRGIDYATIPTTLISMADGVIGKVAVNHASRKNMVGAFYSPRWILIETGFATIDNTRDLAYGLVEVWKHAILEQEDAMRATIQQLLTNKQAMTEKKLEKIIRWSMTTKYKYVKNDWRDETGQHKALSLGHTLANLLETSLAVHHAVAVFYGILFETLMANNIGLLSSSKLQKILEEAKGFEYIFQDLPTIKKFLSNYLSTTELRKDKISSHGIVKFVVPTNAGYTITACDEDTVLTAAGLFQSLNLLEPAPAVKT